MLNRTKFGVDPEDNIYTEEWGLGLPYFEGKPVPLKAAKARGLRVSLKENVSVHIRMLVCVT